MQRIRAYIDLKKSKNLSKMTKIKNKNIFITFYLIFRCVFFPWGVEQDAYLVREDNLMGLDLSFQQVGLLDGTQQLGLAVSALLAALSF